MKFKLVVSDEGIVEKDKGKLARIYFVIDNLAFPEAGWVDSLEILSWWKTSISRLGITSSYELLLFKEGPFKVKATITRSGDVRLLFLEEGLFKEKVQVSTTLSIAQLRVLVFED
ncbi:hypothetical protein FZC78_01980 [Rossellomorea vietnamensis]|uniref:Uncharacterized protein n=1 Tax=Rossellomorea vietnamensis TaxID=218284 RepID=A0A5D4P575_9BACI|nr:hypothetical protein [Rossellomorea vietnamensis]TYS19822.1 hypothetical protein FZC78_01980 [Rossellomorea vietnamensis]